MAARNRDEFQNLKAELDTIFSDLAGYFGRDMPPSITPSIVNLAQGIERELVAIREKQPRGGVKGYISAEADADKILEHYRRLEALFRRLMLNANMDVLKAVNELAVNNRLKELPNSQDAKYRSAKSTVVLRGECTPNTRVQVLADLHEWARDSTSQRIYWLNGMAGTGKTTIAYSFCRQLEDSHSLAASFFCSRQLPGCHDVDQIAPTISYQLSQFSHPLKAAICQALEKDSDVHNQLVLDQFRQLIVEPLAKSKAALPTNLVVVVDALDECDGGRGADMLLALLSYAQDLPVKFFVTSRPDTGILDLVRDRTEGQTPKELRLHELDRLIVKGDIRIYVHTKIASRMKDISESDLNDLVERSGVLFIYAATVVRYIASKNFSRAARRLREVLDGGKTGCGSDSDKHMNALYSAILAAVFEDPDLNETDRAETKQVLYTIVCAQEPLSIDMIAGMLGLAGKTVQAALHPLLSVLHVSDTTGIITTLHESFPDYLLDKNRSGEFHCNAEEHNALLTQICFDQISRLSPAFNICGLQSSHVFDTEVPDLLARVNEAITKELRYACHYWGTHIMLSGDVSQDLASMLSKFLSERFLLWLEVVNLCDHIYDGVRMLQRMQKWAVSTEWLGEHIKQLLRDAWMFAASFCSSPARLSTPHIYVSALTFWPDHNPMSPFYEQDCSKVIVNGSTAMDLRSAIPLSVQNTLGVIKSVSCSPDGAYIVSGSRDGTVRVWDAHTGQQVGQPLEGHASYVTSVASSPDGAHIVSGSHDQTIRIWNARTRQPVGQPLEGHTSHVASIAYSPDGTYIISGSWDKTIRIWDVRTRQQLGHPLDGHTSGVSSVAYSPDGAYIISGSWDNTIRIWDARTLQPVGQPLEGHTSSVYSVAYSPDGAYIVSGSIDKTIRIWDARTRQPVGQPLEGHTSHVASIAYSPDGTYIISGSWDKTIRIWDTRTRQPVGQPLEGHTSFVGSVAYSPDGAYIISGSYDRTIRIWDARTRQPAGQPVGGHTSGVESVVYSPDGAYIVSGSIDKTIRIWDARTRQTVGQPLEGHASYVTSVASSPDGAHIISGSHDQTIRIWNARTRQPVGQPLEGHTSHVASVAYSPDGTYIISGSWDKTIRIWDVRTRQQLGQPLDGHTSDVWSVAYSPDGAYIVSGSQDKTVRIWDARTLQPVGQPLEGHTSDVRSVMYSPDGAYIISGSYDKTIRIWDAHTGQPVGQPLEGHTSDVASVAYSPDGAYIISGSWDNTIRIWNARTRQPVGQPLEGHTNSVSSVAYSPDGAYIISGSSDKTIRIWDAQTHQPVGRPLEGHVNPVLFVAYSPDGTHITSASEDQTMRIWDMRLAIPTGVVREPHNHYSQIVHHVHVTSEDKYIERHVVCNLGCQLDCPYTAWTLRDDGWIVHDNDKLIWVPPDLRVTLLRPQNSAIIYRRGFLQLDLDHNMLGNRWCENFRPGRHNSL